MPVRKKVLIVEDDDDVRLGLHILFSSRHYETFLARDGLSAISQARICRPDLIILDLGLPAGDGFVVLERLRLSLNLATIPVIVVSARSIHENREQALRAGAKAYLQKPWSDTELLATTIGVLGESNGYATA